MNVLKRSLFDSKWLAREVGIEYVDKVIVTYSDEVRSYLNEFHMKDNMYLLLYPLNDGRNICPFEWYMRFDDEELKVIDNKDAFSQITNLKEILCQIVDIYIKYIDDDDVVISSSNFGLKLEDPVTSNYKGRASLVITDKVIKKAKTPEKTLEIKKFYLNEFLDRFIGWNFGVIVSKDYNLAAKLERLNYLVILKELRKDLGTGLELIASETVQPYELRFE
jgi:hypothetical protein